VGGVTGAQVDTPAPMMVNPAFGMKLKSTAPFDGL